jgi:hypothetical protein
MVDPFRRIRTLDPTTRGGSLVEVWLSLIERQAIHRGTFGRSTNSTPIFACINGWNDRCQPLHLDQTAEQMLNKANRKKNSNAGHQEVSAVSSNMDSCVPVPPSTPP